MRSLPAESRGLLAPCSGIGALFRSKGRFYSSTLVASALVVLLLSACGAGEEPLRLVTPAYLDVDEAFSEVGSILAEGGVAVQTRTLTRQEDSLALLVAGEADLAIVENTQPFVSGVRAVAPLYRGVLHMAAREGFNPVLLHEQTRKPTVYVVNRSYTGRLVMDLLLSRSALLGDGFTQVDTITPGETDFLVYLGPISPASTGWYVDGYRLIAMDRVVDAATAEFFSEGIAYLIPQLEAVTIPALTYTLPGNEQAIRALSVDMLLVARKEVPAAQLYRFTKTLLEQKSRFAAVAPETFRWMNTEFAHESLSFPLHSGARAYLERDEPGFLERYAEAISLLVYLLVLCLTGLVALGRWQARRKKNRIDVFYADLMQIKGRLGEVPGAELLAELDVLEARAFEMLIDEQLAADESFRIFLQLMQSTRFIIDGS